MNKQAYFKLMGLDKIAAEEATKKSQGKDKKKPVQTQTKQTQTQTADVDPRDIGRAQYNKHRFAGVTNFALTTALAALLGRAMDNENPKSGAVKGALGGALLNLLWQGGGSALGKLVGPRKAQDELNYLSQNSLSNYLIPGVYGFNKARSDQTGRIFNRNAPYAAVSALVNNGK